MRRTLCALALVLALGCPALAGVIHNPAPTEDPPAAPGEIPNPPAASGEMLTPPAAGGEILVPPMADIILALSALL